MVAAVRTRAVEETLDRLLAWSCRHTRPVRPGVVRLVVDTPAGDRDRYVVATDEGCSPAGAVFHQPNATVRVGQECLTRIVLGEQRGSVAFAAGLLSIEGDVAFAMSWVDQWGRESK
ncbi:SCP2 sterol-binding domain-containing protein [Streptomyces sp. BR1]|uniref:SCP2 sterol-binding domain-containing protein n=1 Tax=Streptomyces sp. BR1 TaxID=1592323 RepID=UPI00402B8671